MKTILSLTFAAGSQQIQIAEKTPRADMHTEGLHLPSNHGTIESPWMFKDRTEHLDSSIFKGEA